MKKNIFIFIILYFNNLSAQQNNISPVKDSSIGIATDARAAGQGDIGVATSPDAFSQFWNPSKYIFSDKKCETGITQIVGNRAEFDESSQLNLIFYNKPNTRSAYSLSFRGYSYDVSQFQLAQTNTEISIAGSYTLKLSETLAMSVGGRFIALGGKATLLDEYDAGIMSLYGVDVSGFYYGKEIAFKKINGRWRAGIHLSNLRGKSLNETKKIEIYAPSTLGIGMGFDFIFNQNKILGITTEYKVLLDSYVEDTNGEKLDVGIEGSVIALGLEFTYEKKIIVRTGYSYGINRLTDSFASIGTGLKTKSVNVDISFLLGLSEEENFLRKKLRLSLSLDMEEIF